MTQANHIAKRFLITMICFVCIGLMGCSKINKESYEKLKMGMGYDEVVQLLGNPDKCESLIAAKSCTWGEAPKTIKIQLIADKVVLFEGQGL